MSLRLTIRPARLDPIAAEYRALKFDHDSGQVYDETVRKAVDSRIWRYWQYKTRGSNQHVKVDKEEGNRGVPSLLNLAIRCTLQNLDSIDRECLEGLDWGIAEILWRAIKRFELDSFHIWRTFVSVYHSEDASSWLYHRQSIIVPSVSLDHYATPIMSPKFEWLTHLTISGLSLPRSELVNLCRIVNLSALDIVAPKTMEKIVTIPTVDDALVRSWSREATLNGAFPKLRVLSIRNYATITQTTLSYLSAFPSLTLYNVTGCSIHWDHNVFAKKLGWSCEGAEDLIEAMQRDKQNSQTWDIPIQACFRRAGFLIQNPAVLGDVEADNKRPILNFRMGPSQSIDIFTAYNVTRSFVFQRVEFEVPHETRKEPDKVVKKRRLLVKPSKQLKFEDLLGDFGGVKYGF